jgi:hypothetical protein
MSSGRPETAIVLAAIAVLLAIGIPALRRGELIIGVPCIALAAVVAGWAVVVAWRLRR